ncbi:FAD-binding protein [Actinomadura luteofluorescens]|uniref:FAD-binding protein n=1 Tax=Actinomadura luteofluorescens TaxID=46163 RepID=UPI00363CB3C9
MERTVDFLCVGGGLGGLAGAVRAHDLGADVLVVERSDMVGGVAAYSGGFVWVGASGLAAATTRSPRPRRTWTTFRGRAVRSTAAPGAPTWNSPSRPPGGTARPACRSR